MAISASDLIIWAFTVVNSARLIAYVPQIQVLLRCTDIPVGISASTWALFLIANLTTVAYAAIVLGEMWMAAIFAGNAIACLTIVALIIMRRRRSSAPAPTGN